MAQLGSNGSLLFYCHRGSLLCSLWGQLGKGCGQGQALVRTKRGTARCAQTYRVGGGIPSLPMPDPAVLSSLLPPPAKSPSSNTHPHPVLSASTSRSCSPNPRLGRSIVRSTTPRSYFLLRKARGRPRVNPSPPLNLLVFEIAVATSTRCTRRHGIPATIGQSDPKLTDGPACSCCDRSHRRPSHQLSWLVWCLSTRNKGGESIEAADQRKSRRREDGDIQRTTAQGKATTDGLRSSRFAR